MFLTEISLVEITKKQYFYKLKAYLNIFYSLMAAQILALLFSFSGVGGMGSNVNNVSFFLHKYSTDIIIIFSIIWIFMISMTYTMNSYRNNDFTFISNRMSSNLSNICFLSTVGIITGLSTSLFSFLLRVIIFLQHGSGSLINENFFINPLDIIVSFLAATFYMLIFIALGYFFGIIFKMNRLFVILVPAIFIASVYFENARGIQIKVLSRFVNIFSHESSLLIFILKAIIFSVVLFILGIWISNRTEVRS